MTSSVGAAHPADGVAPTELVAFSCVFYYNDVAPTALLSNQRLSSTRGDKSCNSRGRHRSRSDPFPTSPAPRRVRLALARFRFFDFAHMPFFHHALQHLSEMQRLAACLLRDLFMAT